MILLLWASLAWGQPQFTPLEEGDVSPFDGRLLNDVAFSKILVDQQLASDECQIAVDYELDIAMAQWSYQMSIQELTLEGKLQRSEVLVESQKEQIVYLQQQVKPAKPFIWITTGFIVGTLSSLGIYHSVKD